MYKNTNNESVNKFELLGTPEEVNDCMLPKFRYMGDKYVRTGFYIKYYDTNGNFISSGYNYNDSYYYFSPGEEKTVLVNLPMNSQRKTVGYDSYTITINPISYEDEYKSVNDLISIGIPSDIQIRYRDGDGLSCYSTVEVENKSNSKIYDGKIQAYFWYDGKIVGVGLTSISSMLAGEKSENTISYYNRSADAVVPDSVTIDISYANISIEKL